MSDDVWAKRMLFDAPNNVGWDALPEGLASMDWGSRWASSRASLLAQVPSVVVPEEFNLLINPQHRDIAITKATKIRRWLYDARIR